MLSGCTAPHLDDSQATTPKPENYKQQVAKYMKTVLLDPYSARDVEITPLFVFSNGGDKYWGTCYRGNSKNAMGGYSGLKVIAISFKDDGTIYPSNMDYADTASDFICHDVKYEPFTEFENLIKVSN